MPLGIRPNRQSLVSSGRATIKPSIPGGSRARALKHRPTTMLTGSELLAKAKELGDASKSNLVRSAYTAQLGLKFGDEFEIKLGLQQIKLIPLVAPEEE